MWSLHGKDPLGLLEKSSGISPAHQPPGPGFDPSLCLRDASHFISFPSGLTSAKISVDRLYYYVMCVPLIVGHCSIVTRTDY